MEQSECSLSALVKDNLDNYIVYSCLAACPPNLTSIKYSGYYRQFILSAGWHFREGSRNDVLNKRIDTTFILERSRTFYAAS